MQSRTRQLVLPLLRVAGVFRSEFLNEAIIGNHD